MGKKMAFDELIQSEKPILIDFFTEWCGPCKAMGPILQDLASQVGDTASIVKIDVDRNPGLAKRLDIRGVPTFMLFKDGQILWKKSGMQSVTTLKNVIAQALDQENWTTSN